ncbi:acylphosphatase [Clostridium sp. AL.422]|uniref:acylphosphatase n=1 Tax=Clostridium TaxID=1485 RepID=UPI00293DAC6F|nr:MULTISPECIES: acylphosphatase [unclassified Clostridium]MDV4152554.1 acylphosphatase [Clostridium sp. AL.422]
MTRYYIVADGRVQGVGFRYYCQMNATNLNLTGWVHNMSNGMVEMEVQGNDNSLLRFISIISRGNYFIKITSLSKKEIAVIPDETKFKIK